MSTTDRWMAGGRWVVRRGNGEPPWADWPAQRLDGLTLQRVRDEVTRHEPPATTVRPAGVRDSAVLIVVFQRDNDVRLVLVQRSEHVGSHRGEVAFPGGVLESGETAVAGALREAWEEIGLLPTAVEVVGRLPDFSATGSGFFITPVVAVMNTPPTYVISHQEIDSAFDVSLRELMAPGVYREEIWTGEGSESTVPFFELDSRTIWGATATIVLDLLVTVLVGQRPAPMLSPPG